MLLKIPSKLIQFLSVVLFAGMAAVAQVPAEKCAVTGSPDFRGLKLGMSIAEMVEKFPGGIPVKNVPGADQASMFNGEDLAKFPRFDGLERILFTTLDGKVDHIEILYTEARAQPNNPDFLKGLSYFLKIPVVGWIPGDNTAMMTCASFRVEATPKLLQFTDLAAEKIRKSKNQKTTPKVTKKN